MKGRKCRPYESNYHSSKGEMLALCYALTKYDHILRLSQFSVVTDSTTVLHWSTMKDTGGKALVAGKQLLQLHPPSCQGKICTVVQLPWHLATANGIEGRGPPLIGAIKGKIVLD